MTAPEPPISPTDRLFVEIGSGSIKALVVDAATGEHVAASRYLGLARLAGGHHRLGPDVLDRLESGLTAVLADLGLPSQPSRATSVVATDSIRRSDDRHAVAELVARWCGTDLTILTPQQEARLGRLAARTRGLGPDRSPVGEPFVTIDIGAGSTEICGPDTAFSLPLGGSTVVTGYLHSDPPRPDELSAALSVIELHLDDLRREHRDIVAAIDAGTVIGLGAFREIAAVEIGVDIDDRDMSAIDGYTLTHDGAEEVFRALATESSADRAFNPGLEAHHVDNIVGAMCVMVEFMRQFAGPDIFISTATLVDGLSTGVEAAALLGAAD